MFFLWQGDGSKEDPTRRSVGINTLVLQIFDSVDIGNGEDGKTVPHRK